MHPTRLVSAVTVCLVLAAAVRGAVEPPATAAEEPVLLPDFLVEGRLPAEGWLLARIGQTEFLSQLSERETRSQADDFVIFQEFVRDQYPEAALPADAPVTVVLCKNTASFRQFGGRDDRWTDSLASPTPLILIDASQVNQMEKAIRRRWVDLAFGRQPTGKFPLWRIKATRQILSDVRIRDRQLEIGFPPFFPSGAGTQGANQFNLLHLMPLEQVLAMNQDSLEQLSAESDLAWRFPAQSTAFMHMYLFGARHRRFREPFKRFVARLEAEPISENLFRDCFGMSYQEMNRWLRGYAIQDTRMKYETHRYRFPPTPPFEVRDARPAEVGRVLREARRRLTAAESAISR